MITIGKYPSIKVKNSQHSLFIKFKYDPHTLEKVKSLPVRYYEPENKVWEIPISDIDRLVNLFGMDNITIHGEFPEVMSYFKIRETKSNKPSTEQLIEYYSKIKCEVDYDFKTKPDGHQIESFNTSLKLDSFLITDVMGLGKTKQAIDIMDYKKSIGDLTHVLVICGVNGLKYNWQDEIVKHSRNNCQVIDGTAKQKMDKLDSYWMFTYNIINIESIRLKIEKDEFGIERNANPILDKIISLCNSGKIQGIILDEFHKVNNHRSQQGRALKLLDCQYKLALSGTPITKAIEKSWNILNWFGYEKASYWNFVKQYCVLGGFSGWETVGYKNLDEMHERFDKYQIRRTKDILSLPPKTHQTNYIEMTREEQSQYNLIKRGLIADMESGEVDQVSPAVAVLKLRLFTDLVKVRALKETIEELNENSQPCVVFSCYKEGLYRLKDELHEYNPLLLTGDIISQQEKQSVIKSFQEKGKSNVLAGTIQALGTGYTLTRAQYVLFLNKSWTITDNEQAEDRCHRRGTTGNVTVISYIVKDSVDEKVEEILANDKVYIDRIVDGIPIFKQTKAVWDKLLEK